MRQCVWARDWMRIATLPTTVGRVFDLSGESPIQSQVATANDHFVSAPPQPYRLVNENLPDSSDSSTGLESRFKYRKWPSGYRQRRSLCHSTLSFYPVIF